jgi:hypothetical protein
MDVMQIHYINAAFTTPLPDHASQRHTGLAVA